LILPLLLILPLTLRVPGGQPGAPQGLNAQATTQTLAGRVATDKTFSQIGLKNLSPQNQPRIATNKT